MSGNLSFLTSKDLDYTIVLDKQYNQSLNFSNVLLQTNDVTCKAS